ncbi:MAG: PAS domain-containing protein, partial [Pirellulales bacterium]|nr:PAS domain-containing protein [Pirellulales bacterium]
MVTREAPKRRAAVSFQFVLGLTYLLIGLFVWRRSPQTKLVKLFYAFCLSSFALYALGYSGELDAFDRAIYWVDAWATLLTPALFLHFCLAYPHGLRTSLARGWAAAAYGLAAGIALVRHLAASGLLGSDRPALLLSELLDRADYAFLGAGLLAGAVVLQLNRRDEEDLVVRTQRRWLAYGAIWGVAPFVAFYVIPFAAGKIPGPNHTLAIFSLALIPLAFAFAIARHRFMDVDLVFRRGAAYTFATAAILTLFYLGIWALSGFAEPRLDGFGPAAWVGSVVAGAIAFNPLRRAIQHALDRRHYRERYDYRRTLADFAVELSAKTDPEQMLALVSERLQRALAVERVAIYTRSSAGAFELGHAIGQDRLVSTPAELLEADPADEGLRYRFVEQPAEDGLSYYVPCHVQGRLIAWIGLGLTENGEYLTTEDLSLVEAISGSFAIALENARLYRSLELKAAQYQRLKDYNENIVESLHVGILAVDLDDRVESWNTQLELLFGISRRDAVGRKLTDVLPPALAAECETSSDETGVHNVYKLTVRGEDFPEEFRPADPA